MNVKIDTKEKFSVITTFDAEIAANMTGELQNILQQCMDKPVPHVVLNMAAVEVLSAEAAQIIAAMQQAAYEQQQSFVVCELQEPVEKMLDEMELLEYMNVTPTESEAWDIVQMEEIERELLNDFDEDDSSASSTSAS
ncbi:MAG: anti-sigma factor antagonist [Chitinophagaceae bacterium]|nr:MAG: anti-sigma factor antagonist [Chitinophagaceae bacterium]